MIYYGFVILLIATELVAIHADTPLKVYQGSTYIVVSFLADFAGIAILIGLGLAYKRRYIEKPDYLSATNPNRELFMYAMLFSLVFLGYIIEGFRIYGAGMPEGEKLWSPIGYALAGALSAPPACLNRPWSAPIKGFGYSTWSTPWSLLQASVIPNSFILSPLLSRRS